MWIWKEVKLVQMQRKKKKGNKEVECDGNEAENEEHTKDEEFQDSDYDYPDDEMPNIDPEMTANMGEEKPNIDDVMVPPNEVIGTILLDGKDTPF